MKIGKDTIARTIVLALALFNQILAILGKGTLEICEQDIYQVVSLVVTIGASAVAWWKNNSFTQAAIACDEAMKKLRAGNEDTDTKEERH